MMQLYAIISVLLVSAVSLIGVVFFQRVTREKPEAGTEQVLVFNKKRFGKFLPLLVAFSVGGLFGDAFIHLLPKAFEELGNNLLTSLSIVAGLLFFFALEKFVRWKHCNHDNLSYHECSTKSAPTMILIGDAIHNLVDGMLIGASYGVSLKIGLATTVAVFLHEIPQEISHFGVLLHGGYSPRKALGFNFLTGLTAVVGAIISLIAGPSIEGYTVALLPITAGGFIYIAGSDLIPKLHYEVKLINSTLQFLSILLGIAVMALLTLLE